jgi:hypothetical protein
MQWDKVAYVFFALMSLSTTAGFLYEPHIIPLLIAVMVNLISTLLKLGSKNIHSQELLISSFVADLHLIPAVFLVMYTNDEQDVIFLAIGAVLANLYSVLLMLIESSKIDEDDYYDY